MTMTVQGCPSMAIAILWRPPLARDSPSTVIGKFRGKIVQVENLQVRVKDNWDPVIYVFFAGSKNFPLKMKTLWDSDFSKSMSPNQALHDLILLGKLPKSGVVPHILPKSYLIWVIFQKSMYLTSLQIFSCFSTSVPDRSFPRDPRYIFFSEAFGIFGKNAPKKLSSRAKSIVLNETAFKSGTIPKKCTLFSARVGKSYFLWGSAVERFFRHFFSKIPMKIALFLVKIPIFWLKVGRLIKFKSSFITPDNH